MRPADPLRLNPVRLNPERLPDSGSISFILPPVRKPSRRCGEVFYLGEKPASEGPLNCGGFDSIFGCLLDGYYTVHYVPPPQKKNSRNAMTLKDLLLTTRGVWT